MSAPPEIIALTERFALNLQDYKSGQYNETQLRREFLDPFFEALGWDVNNKQGDAEAYKEVIHEDSIRIGGMTKAPDYCFRIGGTRKFFVEAKKPSVNIKEDISPAFQLRRYAWSAKLPLSILTDFEEFSVYDCRVKPDKADKPSTARTLYITYKEYEKRWGEIASIFSLEAIRKGSFDRYAEKGSKRGTAEVDAAFLKEIESWRELLARSIALRNPALSQRKLNFSVQQTIDRIIFLRICEDRGIEQYGRLQAATNGANIYRRLCELFRQADDRYNSGLFHFTREKGREHPDEITLNLSIDDKPLKDIIKGLYYPDCPYEFSVLSADILGQVYEQFLGKVIRLTEGHRAVVEDKPEVKKAGGVYYTPTYIVEYIVKNTVGVLLGNSELEMRNENKSAIRIPQSTFKKVTPKDVSNLRILDPACGSGSFLIGAYQYLLDWHLRWYIEHNPESWSKKKNSPIFNSPAHPFTDSPNKNYRLTTAERKRILLNNIYGVDIDPQAVEVTKLSLLLKVLEGESEQTISSQLKMFHQRALPDLDQNIKCGNSLIGPDFYTPLQSPLSKGGNHSLSPLGKGGNRGVEQQLIPLDEEERYRINVFDWKKEFPHMFLSPSTGEGRGEGDGGFDAVIGNPPYVRQEALGNLKSYFQQHYNTFHGMADLYTYFIERGVSLLSEGGLFSYIVANKWMRANYGEPLRIWLKQQCIEEIIDFGDLPVFQNATTYPCIIRIKKSASLLKQDNKEFRAINVKTLKFDSLEAYVNEHGHAIKRETLENGGWSLSDEQTQNLFNKIKGAGVPLGEYVKGKIYYGIKTGLNEAFVIDEITKDRLIAEDPKSAELIKPFLIGRDIKRYVPPTKYSYLILIPRGWTRKTSSNSKNAWSWFEQNYPAISHHLIPFQTKGEKRYDKGEFWWELRACDYYNEFEKPKIIYPNICKKPEFTFDENRPFTNQKCFIISLSDKYLLGLLNSPVIFFLFRTLLPKLRGDFYEPSYVFLKDFPIRPINFSDLTDKACHDKMVALVEQMLEMNRRLADAKLAHEKTALARQIDATDRQIDVLVYELYGLTEEEIKIVESS